MNSLFGQHFLNDNLLEMISDLVLRIHDIRIMKEEFNFDYPNDVVIDGIWLIIDTQIDKLEKVMTPEVFNKLDFQYIVSKAIVCLSYRCNAKNVKTACWQFISRICRMFEEDMRFSVTYRPEKYNVSEWTIY